MQVKCGSKKTCYFVIFMRFEVVTSQRPIIFFLTPPSNNSQYSTEMTLQLPDIENNPLKWVKRTDGEWMMNGLAKYQAEDMSRSNG